MKKNIILGIGFSLMIAGTFITAQKLFHKDIVIKKIRNVLPAKKPIADEKQKKLIQKVITSHRPTKNIKTIKSINRSLVVLKGLIAKLKNNKLEKNDRLPIIESLLASMYEIKTAEGEIDRELKEKKIKINLKKEKALLAEIEKSLETIYAVAQSRDDNELSSLLEQLDKKVPEVPKYVELGKNSIIPLEFPKNEEIPKFSDNTTYIWDPFFIPQAHATEVLHCYQQHFADPKNAETSTEFLDLSLAEVKATPEITALAQKLKTPLEVFRFVQNEIRYQPYFGASQVASSVLMRKSANPADQSSLLISLLRSIGVPSRYVFGDILMSEQQLMKLWKLENQSSVWNMHVMMLPWLPNLRGENRMFRLANINYYRLPHVWVEAFIPFDEKRGLGTQTATKSWVPLDPSVDSYSEAQQTMTTEQIHQFAKTNNLTIFSLESYLLDQDAETGKVVKQSTPDELIAENIVSILNYAVTNNQVWGKTYLEYGDHGSIERIKNESLSIGPSGAEACIFSKDAKLPEAQKVKLKVEVGGISKEVAAIDVASKSLYVSYRGETESDQNVLNQISRGTITNPSEIVKVRPYLMLDEQVLASGNIVDFGAADILSITPITMSEVSKNTSVVDLALSNGEVVSILSSFRMVSEKFIEMKTEEVMGSIATGDISNLDYNAKNNLIASVNNLALLRLQLMADEVQKNMAHATNTEPGNDREVMTIASGIVIDKFLDRAFGFVPKRPTLNWQVERNYLPRFSFYLRNQPEYYSQSNFRLASKSFLVTASSLEHKIFEDYYSLPSQSTVRVIQEAKDRNQMVISAQLTADNIDSVLSQLTGISSSYRQYLKERIINRYGGFPSTFIAPAGEVNLDGRLFRVMFYQHENNFSGFATIGTNNGGEGGDGDWESDTGYDFDDWTDFDDLDPLADLDDADWDNLLAELEDPSSPIWDIFEDGEGVNEIAYCGAPVNLNNGKMWHIFTDFPIIPGPGEPLQLKRIYLSDHDINGPLGFGWEHNFNQRIETSEGLAPNIIIDQNLKLITDKGESLPIPFNNGNYIIPIWYKLSFSKVSGDYVIVDDQKRNLHFWGSGPLSGLLKSIRDRFNNEMTFTYNPTTNKLEIVTDAIGRTLTFSYNEQTGKLSKVTDFSGRFVEFSIDPQGDLTESKDLNGYSTTYTYYSGLTPEHLNHNLKSFKNPEGHGVEYFYYQNDKVFKHVEAENRITTYVYNPFNQETMVIDARGEKKKFQYDIYGNIRKIINPDGTFKSYRYDLTKNKTLEQDEDGNVTRFLSDTHGNIVKITPPAPFGISEYTYHETYNVPTSFRDGRGNLTSYAIDNQNGNITSVKKFKNIEQTEFVEERFEFYANGLLKKKIDAKNNETTITRVRESDFSEMVTILNPLGGTINQKLDPLGRKIEEIDLDGVKSLISYDNLGNILSANLEGDSVSQEFSYDKSNNLISEKRIAEGKEMEIIHTYNGHGDKTSTTNVSLGETTKFEHSTPSCGCSLGDQVSAVIDPKGNKTEYEYNWRGDIKRILDAKGGETLISYDGRGNQSEVKTLAKNKTELSKVNFVYGPLNKLVSKQESFPFAGTNLYKDAYRRSSRIYFPFAPTLTSLNYDSAGNLTQKTIRRAYTSNVEKVLYNYDNYNLLVQKEIQAGAHSDLHTYEYDANMNLTRLKNNVSTVERTFDELNRPLLVKTIPDPVNNIRQPSSALKYDYEKGGQIKSISQDGNPVVTYSRDNLMKLTGVTHTIYQFGISHDAFNRRNKITYPNQMETMISFDDAGRILSMNTNNKIYQQHSYDPAGNLKGIQSDRGQWALSYDQANQLITALYTGTAQIENETFIWDAAGNKINGGVLKSAPSTTSIRERPIYFNNILIEDGEPTNDAYGFGRFGYNHDFKGNIIQKIDNVSGEITYFEWDGENRLRLVKRVDVNNQFLGQMTFRYDAQGRRIEKEETFQDGTIDRRHYVYDRNNILLEFDKQGVQTATYIGTGVIDNHLMMVRNNKPYFYHTDHLGSTIALSDESGKIAQKIIYSSFGKIAEIQNGNGDKISFSQAVDQPFYFTGREWDNFSSLYYYRARYYDPFMGRFVSPDPIGFSGGDYNLLRYVENNPAVLKDPSGYYYVYGDADAERLMNEVGSNSTGMGREVYSRLRDSDAPVYIYTRTQSEINTATDYYNIKNDGLVNAYTWGNSYGVSVNTAEMNDPALLLHELGHADQLIYGGQGGVLDEIYPQYLQDTYNKVPCP